MLSYVQQTGIEFMRKGTCKNLVFTLTILFIQSSIISLSGKDEKICKTPSGAKVYRPYSSPVDWSGQVDAAGFADGRGELQISDRFGNVTAVFRGLMKSGRLSGQVEALYPKSAERAGYVGELSDWCENGRGTMTMRNGERITGIWKNGEIIKRLGDHLLLQKQVPKSSVENIDQKIRDADLELNKTYKQLREALPTKGKEKLQLSQRDWIVKRDKLAASSSEDERKKVVLLETIEQTVTLKKSLLLLLENEPGLPTNIDADNELSFLFEGSTPKVEIASRQASINYAQLSYLSVVDGVAVTSSVIHGVNFRNQGELQIWDLSGGKLRYSLPTPGRIMAIAGVRGSGRVMVVGGPWNKDISQDFVWAVDLKTGKKVLEFNPAHSGSETNLDLTLRFSKDGNLALVRDDSGAGVKIAVYDINGINRNHRIVASSYWDMLPSVSNESASSLQDTPSWIPYVGDCDGELALAIDTHGVASLYRTDTWERVSSIGDKVSKWQSWSAAPDGLKLLSWRHDHTDGFTIWDFEEFRVMPFEEPGFCPDIPPAFSEDGRFVRYKRQTAQGKIEIISKDLKAGSESIAIELPQDSFDHYLEVKGKGVFSANGDHLLLSGGESNQAIRVSWNNRNRAEVVRLSRCLKTPISISDDGKIGTAAGDALDKGEKGQEFTAKAYDLLTGEEIECWKVLTGGHTPTFSGAHHPETGQLAFSHYTAGPSMGYYAGDVVIFDKDRFRSLPGFHLTWDSQVDPQARDANAWSVTFLRASSELPALLGVYTNKGRFITYDLTGRRVVHKFEWDDFNGGVFDRTGFPIMTRLISSRANRIFLPVRDGSIRVVDLLADGSNRHVADLWSLANHGWFAITPQGYYAMSQGSERLVFFRLGKEKYSFEQFDAYLNRPDKVAAALGADAGEVESLHQAYLRRLKGLGIVDIKGVTNQSKTPRLEIDSPAPLFLDAPEYCFTITASAQEGAKIERVIVSANGVPVFGEKGKIPQQGASESISEQISLALIPGENQIQVSVRDSRAVESTAKTVRIQRSSAELNKPELYLLAIGVSNYSNDSLDLKYPSKDAIDVVTNFRKSGREFSAIHDKVIVDSAATRTGVLAAREFLRQSQPNDRVIVFVAGHGIVDNNYQYYFCTHEFDFDRRVETGVTYEDLQSLFDGVDARERLMFMDTCQAGAVDSELFASLDDKSIVLPLGVRAIQGRGLQVSPKSGDFKNAKSSRRFVEKIFADLRRGTGATILSASNGLEFALESDAFSNGIFTYSVIDALRDLKSSDQNGDGVLRVSELVQQVSNKVAVMTGGLQHPNARAVNLAVDFAVVRDKVPGGPEDPELFLHRYLEWSSSEYASSSNIPESYVLDRLVGLFQEPARYFNKTLHHRQIHNEVESYNKKFSDRTYQVRPGTKVTRSQDGNQAQLDYTMDFKAGDQKGTLKMRMVLVWNGRDWRIATLETR